MKVPNFTMKKQLKYPLLLFFALSTIALTYVLHSKNEAQELWGHFPLAWELSAYGLFVMLFAKRWLDLNGSWRAFAFSSISGVLLAAGFPPVPFPIFVFIGFVPLLWISEEYHQAGKKGVWKYAFNTFIIWNILTTFWVANTAFLAGIGAVIANTLLLTIPFSLALLVRRQKGTLNGWFAFVAMWISFEYMHQRWDLSWPWLELGNALASFPKMAQWYEYTGIFGGSLWILLLNVLIFQLTFYKKYTERTWLIGTVLAFLFPILISFNIYYSYEARGPKSEVALIQPNFEPHYEKFSISRREAMGIFLKLSKEVVTEETDYLIMPETSFGGLWLGRLETNNTVATLQDFVDDYPNLALLAGFTSFVHYGLETSSPTARKRMKHTGELKYYYDVYNSAVQFSANQDSFQLYHKSKLVPGAEKMPYPNLFKFLEPLALELGGMAGSHGDQAERAVFKNGDIMAAPIICYESIYGEYVTEYVKKGANVLFIITNDGWWDHTAGHKQHLAFARLRAIETRRSIGRSANTGISCFIDQRGEISKATKYDEAIGISSEIYLNYGNTFYVVWGDMIARIMLFLSGLLLGLSLVNKMTNKS